MSLLNSRTIPFTVVNVQMKNTYLKAIILAALTVNVDSFIPSQHWISRNQLIGVVASRTAINTSTSSTIESSFSGSEDVLGLLDAYRLRTKEHRGEGNLSRRTLVYLLFKLSQIDQGDDAKNLLTYMIIASENDASLLPDTNCLNMALKALGSQDVHSYELLKDWQMWHETGRVAEPPDVISYNTVLASLADDSDLAEEVFNDMIASDDVDPNDISYATLLRNYASQGNVLATKALLEDMKTSGVPPTAACYEQVLAAYINIQQPERAVGFLQEWENEEGSSLVPDLRAQSYNIVLHVFAHEDYERAQRFLEIMTIRDKISYNTLIEACCQQQSVPDALDQVSELLEQAYEDKAVALDAAFMSTAFYSLAGLAHTDVPRMAEEILKTFMERGIRVDKQVYNSLIHCWAKSGDASAYSRVMEILEKIENDPRVRPDIRTFVTVLDCLTLSKDAQSTRDAEALIQRMEEDPTMPAPNVQAYTSLIKNYARSRSPYKASQAFSVLKRMKAQSTASKPLPNIITYNTVLNAAEFTDPTHAAVREQALKIAFTVFDDVRQSNLKPTHVTFATFLGCIARLMPMEQYLSTSKKVIKKKAQRDEVVSLVFRRCASQGMVSQTVLKKLRLAVSKEQFDELLNNVAPDRLPKSWTWQTRDYPSSSFR